MYDGFAKIDGGGPGRDAGDDMRIEMNEWTQGYTTVTRHGFVRLAALADVSKKEAKEVFATQIDDNGGGIVLLDEWCEWLKKGEIDANTPIGLLLNASEGGKAAVEEDTAAQEARIHAMQEEKVKVEHAARLNKAKQFEAGERLALDKEEARADKIREFLQIFDQENARQDATWKNYERHATQPEKAKHKIDLAGRVEKLKKMKEELRVAKYKVQWKAEEHQRALGALKRARKPPKVDPTLGHKQVDKAKERAEICQGHTGRESSQGRRVSENPPARGGSELGCKEQRQLGCSRRRSRKQLRWRANYPRPIGRVGDVQRSLQAIRR
jgi:hypothetical protein